MATVADETLSRNDSCPTEQTAREGSSASAAIDSSRCTTNQCWSLVVRTGRAGREHSTTEVGKQKESQNPMHSTRKNTSPNPHKGRAPLLAWNTLREHLPSSQGNSTRRYHDEHAWPSMMEKAWAGVRHLHKEPKSKVEEGIDNNNKQTTSAIRKSISGGRGDR
jgi:hypothetical protein